MPADARGRLSSDPFSFRVTKDGNVHVSQGGRRQALGRAVRGR